MKSILELLLKIGKAIFPKSRWANIVYLVIGYIIANYDQLAELIKAIFSGN